MKTLQLLFIGLASLLVNAYTFAQTPPGANAQDPIAIDCARDNNLRIHVDCSCFALKSRELRLAAPQSPEEIVYKRSYAACPSFSAIRTWHLGDCLRNTKLQVPQGIDENQFCQCKAEEIAKLYVSIAGEEQTANTGSTIASKAGSECTRRVQTPAAPIVAIGEDLSGTWDLRIHGVSFVLSLPPTKATTRKSTKGVLGKRFPGELVQSVYRSIVPPEIADVWIDPDTGILYLSVTGALSGCTSESARTEPIQGECKDFFILGRAPFTLSKLSSTAVDLVAGTELQRPASGSVTPVPKNSEQVTAPAQIPRSETNAPTPISPPVPTACTGGSLSMCTGACAMANLGVSLESFRRIRECTAACRQACR